MSKLKDVTGEKYHMLTITGLAPSKREPSGRLIKRVYTICECGRTNESSYKNLKRGLIKSCGCLNENLKTNVEIGDTYGFWVIKEEVEPCVYKGLITVIKNYDKVTQTYTMAQLLLYNV